MRIGVYSFLFDQFRASADWLLSNIETKIAKAEAGRLATNFSKDEVKNLKESMKRKYS